MSEFIQGIKNFVSIVLLGGALFATIIIWNATAPVYDILQSSNTTWGGEHWVTNTTDLVYGGYYEISGNLTATSPTSEAIAQSWKYIMFFIPVGGIIAMAIYVSKRTSRG